ncbi:hypothetical protein VTL71DRAFT_11509 [Oculimacula yallundae]|uniref:Uncharacterized protein n=1 Tax=Oculimacula yallundae TaxID=86028 RepID=A0ABR4CSK0_9HELO
MYLFSIIHHVESLNRKRSGSDGAFRDIFNHNTATMITQRTRRIESDALFMALHFNFHFFPLFSKSGPFPYNFDFVSIYHHR